MFDVEKLRKALLKPYEEQVSLWLKDLLEEEVTESGISGHKCFNCDNEAEHLHHVVPRSVGGTAMVPLCTRCHGLAHHIKMSSSNLIKLGLERAKAKGKKLGRPKECDDTAIRRLRDSGMSYRKIATVLNISKSAVQRALKVVRNG